MVKAALQSVILHLWRGREGAEVSGGSAKAEVMSSGYW